MLIIGVMPASALLRSPRINTNTLPLFASNLEGSFLYLSLHPSFQPKNGDNILNENGTGLPIFQRDQPSTKSQPSTVLQPTIPQNKVYGVDNKSLSSASSQEKPAITGPYGGYGKKKSTSAGEEQQNTYWGATGFLTWATTGINTQQQQEIISNSEQNKKQGQQLDESGLSVNWNDQSTKNIEE